MSDTIQRISHAIGQRLSPLHRRLLRIVLLVVTAIMAILVTIQLAAPLLISTPIVRNGMEQVLSDWTGDEVTIDGAPRITFVPIPRIEVSQVAITKPTSKGIRLVARISRLSAQFSLYQALQGRIAFQDFELTDPEFFISRDRDGKLDWADGGLLRAAARDASMAGGTLTLDEDLDPRVGEVTIENGRLEIEDQGTGQTWRATGIAGNLEWPRLSEPASLQVSARVGDRNLQFSGSSSQPLMLLSDRDASFEGRFSSDIVSGRYNGTVNLATHAFSGDVELNMPDASAALAKAGIELPGLEKLKQFSLNARVQSSRGTTRFDALDLSLDGTEADGVIDLSLPTAGPPRVTGTLALERLDLPAVISAITPTGAAGSELARGVDLDLRISSEEMSYGPLLVTRAALGIMNEGQQSRVDIVDGMLEGGRLTSQLVTSKAKSGIHGDVRITLRDANLPSLMQRLGISAPLPEARGSLELTLKTAGGNPTTAWRDAEGTVRFRAGAGTLPDLDPVTMLQRIGSLNYQPLKNPDGQDFDYDRLDLSAAFKNGTAEIQSGIIENEAIRISLSGIVPFAEGGLALSAQITSPTDPEAEHNLFIGGSAANPVAIAVPGPGKPANP